MTRFISDRQGAIVQRDHTGDSKFAKQEGKGPLRSLGEALKLVQRVGYTREAGLTELQDALTISCKRLQPNAGVEDFSTASLGLTELRKLLQSPSTWAGRSTIGLRGKQTSKKTAAERTIPNCSPYTSKLRKRWLMVLNNDQGKKFDDLHREAADFEHQHQFENAADNYFERIGWARELFGEAQTVDFVESVTSYLRCCKKMRASGSRDLHDENALRFLVKMMNFSASERIAPVVKERAQAALTASFVDNFLLNLISRVAMRADGKAGLPDDSTRHALILWDVFLRDRGRIASLSSASHTQAIQNNQKMIKLQSTQLMSLSRFVVPPLAISNTTMSKFLVDVSESRYVSCSCEPLDHFVKFVNDQRVRTAEQARQSEKSAAVLLLGPTGSGKTELAKCLANELGAEMFKIRSVDIKTKWVGESELTLKQILGDTKIRAAAAKNASVVVLFDELDGLAKSRSTEDSSGSAGSGGDRAILNLLLGAIGPDQLEYTYVVDGKEMLGEIVVVGTTNKPGHIDNALLRRFQTRIFIPRWTPEQNIELLTKISYVPPAEGRTWAGFAQLSAKSLPEAGETPFYENQMTAAMGMRLLSTFLVSRAQLRQISSAARKALLAAEHAQSRSAGENAWDLVSNLLAERKGRDSKGDLVPNSLYQFPISCDAQTKMKSASPGHLITAFRVSLEGLMSEDAISLDLDQHPYVAIFEIKSVSCALILTQKGVSMLILEDRKKLDGSLLFNVHGYLSGASPQENQKNISQSFEDRSSGLPLDSFFALDHSGKIDYRIRRRADGPISYYPEKNLFSEAFGDYRGSMPLPFAQWNEVVPGAFSFHDAKEHLISYRCGVREVSLEVFVEGL